MFSTNTYLSWKLFFSVFETPTKVWRRDEPFSNRIFNLFPNEWLQSSLKFFNGLVLEIDSLVSLDTYSPLSLSLSHSVSVSLSLSLPFSPFLTDILAISLSLSHALSSSKTHTRTHSWLRDFFLFRFLPEADFQYLCLCTIASFYVCRYPKALGHKITAFRTLKKYPHFSCTKYLMIIWNLIK